MDNKKIIFQIILTLLLVSSVGVFGADDDNWEIFTSYKDVRKFLVHDNHLYGATSGGLIIVADSDSPAEMKNRQHELGTNDLSDIIADSDGQLWLSGMGRLIKYNASSPEITLFFDNDNNLIRLTRLYDNGDFLWVGLENGLVLFDKITDNGQIQQSYELFGNLNPNPQVNDILVTGDTIWLATSEGLAMANNTNPTALISPSAWTTFDNGTNPELLDGVIKKIVRYMGTTYVASENSLFIFDGTNFTPIGLGDEVVIYDLTLQNDSLLIYYTHDEINSIGRVEGPAVYSLSVLGLSIVPATGVSFNGQHWVDAKDGGIYYQVNNSFIEYADTGLPDNNVEDLTINKNGVITANFRYKYSATLADGLWQPHVFWIRSGLTKVISDSTGQPLIGSEGNGLWYVTDSGLVNYDENNSSLRGNSDVPPAGLTFVYIKDMATDGRYLYLACYRAVNNYPVAIAELNNLDSPNGWDSIGTANGLTDHFVSSLSLLGSRLAVSSESNGIFLTQLGSDPFNSNKATVHYTRDNSLLISNSVRTVRFSPQGVLFAGTNFGLSYLDEGINFFRDIDLPETISSDITALEFDSRGNLWIGTRDGLAYRDFNSGEMTVYTTFNSKLSSNVINEITFDRFTGDIYIATLSGITKIPSTFGKPVFEIEQSFAFPNPFIIENESDRLNFNFGEEASVDIFNGAGEKIAETSANAGWNGKNKSGKNVASGVYIFIITDKNNNRFTGKILLVRK